MGASAHANTEQLAKRLHKRDPGGLVGGKSIVGTKPGQELQGVPGERNFIIALADGQTIQGASRSDELGVGPHAKNVDIVPSNKGHSLIVGGRGSKIVVSGKGHNLIQSDDAGATIILESPGNEVTATGSKNKIVCADNSSNELIERDEGVMVSKSCHGNDDQIEDVDPDVDPVQPAASASASASTSATAHSSSSPIFGSGGDGDPFYTFCDFRAVDCTKSFPARNLRGLWANEHVPSYDCLSREPRYEENPFLLNARYAPAGTTLPRGVEVRGLGSVGVSILDTWEWRRYGLRETGTRRDTKIEFRPGGYTAGGSSATNWTTGSASYQVVLHCTSDYSRGYTKDGLRFVR
jgi:hypothetical protein